MPDDDVNQRPFPTKLVGSLVLLILLVIFWGQNRKQVTIRYLGLDADMRIWVALAISGFVGFLIGLLVARRGRD